jgi:hypothetical protein
LSKNEVQDKWKYARAVYGLLVGDAAGAGAFPED